MSQVEQIVMCLYQLSENGEYGDLRDEMICMRPDSRWHLSRAMSQKLHLDADLTLESAKKMVRQREAAGTAEDRVSRRGLTCGGDQQKSNKRTKPSNITRPQREQGTVLQPAISVPGVARDHAPDSFAQPGKPPATTTRRKDTTSHSVFPKFLRLPRTTLWSWITLPFWMQSAMRTVVLHGTSPYW